MTAWAGRESTRYRGSPTMYTTRPWTMRQYAGSYGQASNQRYHQLLAAGTAGLSVAFDLPTQMGYDSDAPLARRGGQGQRGDRLDRDMRVCFAVSRWTRSPSMTINARQSVVALPVGGREPAYQPAR